MKYPLSEILWTLWHLQNNKNKSCNCIYCDQMCGWFQAKIQSRHLHLFMALKRFRFFSLLVLTRDYSEDHQNWDPAVFLFFFLYTCRLLKILHVCWFKCFFYLYCKRSLVVGEIPVLLFSPCLQQYMHESIKKSNHSLSNHNLFIHKNKVFVSVWRFTSATTVIYDRIKTFQ